MKEKATSSVAAASLLSSSDRSSSSAQLKKGVDNDDDIRRVPEFEGEAFGTTTTSSHDDGPAQLSAAGSRSRGRSTADKENRRLKRLLKNIVSAQHAREKKKAYMIDLEARVKEIEAKHVGLVERQSTLQNENQILRQVVLVYFLYLHGLYFSVILFRLISHLFKELLDS